MKAAKQRAEAWLTKMGYAPDERSVEALMKFAEEQHSITRAACANATICYPAHTTAYEACLSIKNT